MMEAGESQVFILSKMKESSHILQVRRNIQEGEYVGKVGNTGRYCPHVSGFGTSRERLGDLIRQVVDLKKLEYKSASLVPIGANLSDFLFVHRPHAPPWRRADLERSDR